MMTQFKDIEAIAPDLYLCTSTNYDKVSINGKGEIVKELISIVYWLSNKGNYVQQRIYTRKNNGTEAE